MPLQWKRSTSWFPYLLARLVLKRLVTERIWPLPLSSLYIVSNEKKTWEHFEVRSSQWQEWYSLKSTQVVQEMLFWRCLAMNYGSLMRSLISEDHDLQTHLNLTKYSGGSHDKISTITSSGKSQAKLAISVSNQN